MKKYVLLLALLLWTAADGQLLLSGFHASPFFHEQTRSFTLGSDVKVLVNAPASIDPAKRVLLVFFALPNGNTTAQTIGKQLRDSVDWHYDIQHIGAQTRFLREASTGRTIVTAYLESAQKSWPAWRRQHPENAREIPALLDTIKNIFAAYGVDGAITGHSGGGSLAFGYLNGVEAIPPWIERIAFLDSDYAYDDSLRHGEKLAAWLAASDAHCLCVLAYNDSIALLNGKPFVSATGGTWYRSKLMMKKLSSFFPFTAETQRDPAAYSALGGRVQFWMKENPGREIFHTVQVERNGFIQAMLAGTVHDGKGYVYFGERAYTHFVQPEEAP